MFLYCHSFEDLRAFRRAIELHTYMYMYTVRTVHICTCIWLSICPPVAGSCRGLVRTGQGSWRDMLGVALPGPLAALTPGQGSCMQGWQSCSPQLPPSWPVWNQLHCREECLLWLQMEASQTALPLHCTPVSEGQEMGWSATCKHLQKHYTYMHAYLHCIHAYMYTCVTAYTFTNVRVIIRQIQSCVSTNCYLLS